MLEAHAVVTMSRNTQWIVSRKLLVVQEIESLACYGACDALAVVAECDGHYRGANGALSSWEKPPRGCRGLAVLRSRTSTAPTTVRSPPSLVKALLRSSRRLTPSRAPSEIWTTTAPAARRSTSSREQPE